MNAAPKFGRGPQARISACTLFRGRKSRYPKEYCVTLLAYYLSEGSAYKTRTVFVGIRVPVLLRHMRILRRACYETCTTLAQVNRVSCADAALPHLDSH